MRRNADFIKKRRIKLIWYNPRRGEVWDVDLDPTIGTEIQKTRPAVVVNINSIKHLKIRLIAPSQVGIKNIWKKFGSLTLNQTISMV